MTQDLVSAHCGAPVGGDGRLCARCACIAAPDSSRADTPDALSWEADIALVNNPLVVRQLMVVALGSGLFMALLLTFISATTGDFEAIPTMLLIALLAAVGLGLLLFLVALALFGNRTRVRFTIDDEGARWETVDQTVRVGSRAALLTGILSKSPQTAGTGALAASRENEALRWDAVCSVGYNTRQRMITLRNSWRPIGMLICLADNCEEVLNYINARVAPSSGRTKPAWRPLIRALLRTALVILAAAPLFTLSSYPFELDLLLPLVLLMFALATVWFIPLFGWVVMGCGGVVTAQITLLALSDAAYWDGYQQAALILSYVGLAYLAWASWRSVRGRTRPLLFED